MMYETSVLTSGFSLEEPGNFATRIHNMIKYALSIKDSENIEETLTETKETTETKQEATKMEQID